MKMKTTLQTKLEKLPRSGLTSKQEKDFQEAVDWWIAEKQRWPTSAPTIQDVLVALESEGVPVSYEQFRRRARKARCQSKAS